MPTPRRAAPPAAIALILAVLALTGCSATEDEPASTPAAVEWPEAVALDDVGDEEFFVVWTGVAESGPGAETELQPSVDALAEVGYDTLPWDPKCQSGAEEGLIALTGFADPLGVGIPFATAEDAGAFDTLYEGAIVTVSPGTHTCAS